MSDSPRPAKPVAAHIQSSFLCGVLAGAVAVLPVHAGAAAVHRGGHPAGAAAVHPRVEHHAAGGSQGHAHTASTARSQVRVALTPAARTKVVPAARRVNAAERMPGPHSGVLRDNRNKVELRRAYSGYPGAGAVAKTRLLERSTPIPQPTAANQATEDRVHAWLRWQHASEAAPVQSAPVHFAESTDSPAPIERVVKSNAARPAAPLAVPDPSRATASQPVKQLSQAALQNDEAAHAAAPASPSRTATDDNAAISEESHIPSTAPTERTASPFTHGDFNLPPGTSSQAAPVLRASSPAASALLALNNTTPIPVAGVPAANVPAASGTVSGGLSTVKARMGPDAVLSPAEEDAANAASLVKVNLYDSAGKLILIPPMKGTHEILVHQNQMAFADGLQRIANDSQLGEMRRAHLLVALPETAGIGVDERLPLNRRYARPWSVHFLNDLARAHYARFRTPLIVTSAVRTVAFQRHLVLVNGNAAPPTGDIASPHLYGQAVDIAKHGMATTELAWMRAYLTPVETQGKIDVEEEFQQACFHISVYRSYLGAAGKQPTPPPELPAVHTLQQAKATPAKHRHLPTALLATGLR